MSQVKSSVNILLKSLHLDFNIFRTAVFGIYILFVLSHFDLLMCAMYICIFFLIFTSIYQNLETYDFHLNVLLKKYYISRAIRYVFVL